MKRRIAKLLLLSLWPLAVAAQHKAAGWNEISGEKKHALGLKGDAARGAEAFQICQGCHKEGATGSVSGAYPRLAGQHASVLIEQMADIRSGRRSNPKMLPFADKHVLSAEEMADIAAYLQALPLPPNLGRGPGSDLARGKRLYDKDCAICHGDRGEGDAEQFYPLVAGQHYRYLLREAYYIRDGNRGNAHPDMVKVIKAYGNDDLEAVSDYMSRLAPP